MTPKKDILQRIKAIMQRWPKASILALLLLIGGLLWIVFGGKEKDEKEYETVKVVIGDIDVSILSTGTVEPENRLELKPPVAGRIDAILVQEGDRVGKGQLLARMSSTERAAILDSARARGEGELRRWEDFYRATPVYAPISGTIILRAVEPGQTVTNQDPVLVMADRLAVKARVDETDLARIRLGQNANITLDAYPNEPLQGKVTHIAYEATVVNNVTNYFVDVVPTVTPVFLRSGMTANVEFLVAQDTKVLTLPQEAVKKADNKSTVLVSIDDEVKPRTVVTGLTNGKDIEIVSGLKSGDVVLVEKFSAEGKKPQGTNPFAPPRRGGGGGGGRNR